MKTLSDQKGRSEQNEIIPDVFTSTERENILQDRYAIEALSALAAYSPALSRAVSARSDLARRLFIDKAFEKAADLENLARDLDGQLTNAEELAGLQSGLRRFRLQELTRLAVRDLTGRADLAEVTATLSALAEVCLDRALKAATGLASKRFGLNPEALGLDPIIMSMGKLGGRELNYSSDIDLVYLYRPNQAASDAPPPESVADFIFTTVTRAMSEVTEDGWVFRVDLNLRPGGKEGAQAQSLETARKHYLLLGQPWERMALLKARPVAGDIQAGHLFLNELSPFIFRRYLDYKTLEELNDLKQRFTREKRTKISRISGPGRTRAAVDVKLSPGGIREIEFFAQTLTLIFGGRLPHLRHNSTLESLAVLAEEGFISRSDAAELSTAYVFLRTVEHRLQLKELTQTQTLPREGEAGESLARSLGFGENRWADFSAELASHMGLVKKRFDSLLAEPDDKRTGNDSRDDVPEWVYWLLDGLDDTAASLDLLSEAGFQRPEAALAACRYILEGRFLPGPLSRYGRRLERLLPTYLAAVAVAADPDRAILHLECFLNSIGPKAGFLVLLEENPQLTDLLATTFGYSDYLSGILVKHPAILDSLIDRRSALLVKDRLTMTEELDTMLNQEEDPEAGLTIIRRFKNDETLRVGLYDLKDKLSWVQVQEQLTDLAETVMARTLDLAATMVLPDWDRQETAPPLAVMGLGKLGGRELSYASDLDLIFILGREPGDDRMSMETAIRLAQRFISYLSIGLDAGPGYEIDSRLRPSGRSGPLVVTLESFIGYHHTSQLWERQALLKLRHCLGPPALCAQVKKVAEQAIFEQDMPEDAAKTIDHLKQRMARERGRIKAGTINLKFSPGGLVEAEFLTQYLQLVHGRRARGGLRSETTKTALRSLVKNGLGPPNLSRVVEAYEIISRAACRLDLVFARHGDRAAYTPHEIAGTAISVTDSDPLTALTSAMETVRNAYTEVFHSERTYAD